jgi:hypothetical protein
VMVAAPCGASGTGSNVVAVTQHATVPTYFINMLNLFRVSAVPSLTLSATATATMASGANDQVNVAMVLDTTASMASSDSDCGSGATRISCALNGVQTMLKLLAPCTASTSTSSSTCVGYDQVSLFTFPNVQANTASHDTTCPSSNPTILPYAVPTQGATWSAPTGTAATYQVSNYLSNWSSSNAVGGSLNTSSALTIATGGASCNGVQTPGGDGTYYAAAIIAAQSSQDHRQQRKIRQHLRRRHGSVPASDQRRQVCSRTRHNGLHHRIRFAEFRLLHGHSKHLAMRHLGADVVWVCVRHQRTGFLLGFLCRPKHGPVHFILQSQPEPLRNLRIDLGAAHQGSISSEQHYLAAIQRTRKAEGGAPSAFSFSGVNQAGR